MRFGAQQYLAQLVREDVHDVSRLVALPELHGDPVWEPQEWIYEHLK